MRFSVFRGCMCLRWRSTISLGSCSRSSPQLVAAAAGLLRHPPPLQRRHRSHQPGGGSIPSDHATAAPRLVATIHRRRAGTTCQRYKQSAWAAPSNALRVQGSGSSSAGCNLSSAGGMLRSTVVSPTGSSFPRMVLAVSAATALPRRAGSSRAALRSERPAVTD